jgi:hypothetical protein
MTKLQMSKNFSGSHPGRIQGSPLLAVFAVSDFGFVSNFDIRISDFPEGRPL